MVCTINYQVLFEELRLDTKLPQRYKVARTAINQHKSTSETVLKQLASIHPLPGIILEYRQVNIYIKLVTVHVRTQARTPPHKIPIWHQNNSLDVMRFI